MELFYVVNIFSIIPDKTSPSIGFLNPCANRVSIFINSDKFKLLIIQLLAIIDVAIILIKTSCNTDNNC